MDPTVALMSRVQLIEGPFLNEFIEYYRNIGINHFYFINTEPKNLDKIKAFISSLFLKNVTFYNHNGNINKFDYCRNLFNKMTQDYILHVDTDEFLILPKTTPTLPVLIQHDKNVELFIFKWTFIVVNKLYSTSMLNYLFDPNAMYNDYPARKVMFKRSVWLKDPTARLTPHLANFNTIKTKTFEPLKKDPFILHFCVRSYLHTIEKCKHQKLKVDSTKSLDEMLVSNDPQFSLIHVRFKITVALLATNNGFIKDLHLHDNFNIPLSNMCVETDLDVPDEYNLCKKINKLTTLLKKYGRINKISKINISLVDYTHKISTILNNSK